MLPRFLVVSKYELRQYRGSLVDEAVVLLVILAGFLMLVTPEVGEASLPSSHKIYRVGFVPGGVVERVRSYSLEFIPFKDKYEMLQASSLNLIDGFIVEGRTTNVVFGSGTRKSDAALSHLSALLSDFNYELVFDQVRRNANLSGILLPVRLQVIGEEIDYQSAMNGSIDRKRRQVLGVTRRLAENTSTDVGGEPLGGDSPSPAREGGGGRNLSFRQPQTANATGLTLPSELSVDFPFKSLYKNMSLLSPIIMLSILLSLSLARERVDRNIENLFESPLTNAEILFGKSLPYLAVMALFSLGYGLQATFSFEALKVALVFMVLSVSMLSFGIFAVLISRSYRELTFIGSFSLFAFFFFIVLPNVFAGINVLAFISPLDTVTSIENGADIPGADIILSLLPYGFLSMFFLSFTGVCFNAEVMFSSMDFESLLFLFYGNMSRLLRNGLAYVAVSVALLVPFVFIVESIMAYLVMPLGNIAPLASIIALATVEEVVKILPFYYRKMNPVVYGLVAGVSFFTMEKLFNLYLIYKVYSFLGGPYAFFLRKFLPTLALHIASTAVFAAIVYRPKRVIWYVPGLLVAVTAHVVYNILVMTGAV